MSLHYQSSGGLQGVVKTNKGIEIKNARLNVKNATPGLSFNGNDELVNEWYQQQAGSDVDMNFWRIDNLSNPTLAQSGATKDYVDTNVSNWASNQAQSDIDANGYKVTNLGAPASAQDATSKRYVDSLAGTPPLKNNLRAYYALDGDYKDSTTNNYDGTNNGTSFTSGKINQGVSIDNGNYVDVAPAFNWGAGDFTLASWVYPRDDTATNRRFVEAGPPGNTSYFQYSGFTSQAFRIYTEDSGGSDTIETNPNYPPNNWYFVVYTRTGTTGEIWINGQKIKQGTVRSGDISGATSHVIGDNYDNKEDSIVDEVGAWLRVLSQEEILHLYNNGNGTQYLSTYDWYAVTQHNHVDMNGYRVSNIGEALQSSDAVDKAYVDSRKPMSTLYTGARAYYTFNGDYTDSINGYDGTEQGGGSLSFSSTAKLGQSLEFSGTDGDYVDLGSGAFNFGTGDFTWQLFFNRKSDNGDNFLLVSRTNATNHLYLNIINGEFQLEEDRNGNGDWRYSSGVSPNLNQWYHIIVTRTNNTYQIYIDGIKKMDVSSSAGGVTNLDGSDSYIGSSGSYNPDVYIDEVGAWTRALTKNEIKYLYHEGQGTNDFVSYDYTFNYDVDMNQNQIANLASASTTTFTINDDAVSTYSPPNNYGVAMLQAVGDIIMIMYDVSGNNTQFVQQFGSLFNDSSGTDLTGTTGNDGTVNISSNGGEIHIENRSGSQTDVRLLVIF